MKNTLLSHRAAPFWPLAGLAATLIAGAALAADSKGVVFASTNSVSDIQGVAHDTDPLVVNPWGLVPGPEGNLHVNDNGTGVNGHYAPGGALITGSAVPHSFKIPQATTTSGTIGSPTGIVLDKFSYLATGTNDFRITGTGSSGSKPSHYIIATEDGAICGYNENLDPGSAIKAADGSPSAGYTGVALSWVTGSNGNLEHRLYAANFRAGNVDVFDTTFTKVALTGSDTFTDPDLPTPPAGYTWSPFNVHHVSFIGRSGSREKLSVQRRILVAYALHSGTAVMNDVPSVDGTNYGAVAVFNPEGQFLRELVPQGGLLDSPWGMAIAHVPVGLFGARTYVLIGNHGNGQINCYAFDAGAKEGAHILTFSNNQGIPLAFDGLWALHFGPKKETMKEFLADVDDLQEDPVNLYFSAGLLDGTYGLVGKIVVPHIR
jgi:uncharacterized protein (TIGR03118 family)